MTKNEEVDVLDEVLRLIEETLKIEADKIDIDANFETFGINSLIVMELMENIEKVFEVTLTPAQFSNVDTVRGLVGLLEGMLVENAGDAAPAGAGESRATTGDGAPIVAGEAPARPAGETGSAATLSGGADDAGQHQRVAEYIARNYGIDLSRQRYRSVDELVEALVSEHSATLMRHYGLADGASSRDKGPARQSQIAIVGLSCRFPDAETPKAFWDNLINRRNSIREIPKSRWNWEIYYAESAGPGKTVSRWGGLIDDVDRFDADFFSLPAEEAAAMDPQQRLVLQETYHAVEDAGLDMSRLAGSATGVFVGYEYSEYEHHLRRLNNQDVTKGPLFSSSSPSYYLSNQISYIFDLCGPSESFNVNCASSAVALNRAYHSLLNGESEVAVAGAVSLNLFEGDYIASSQYGILSPDGTSGVFDDEANGFTRGEGVAAVVLKRLEDAERDNNPIYAIVRASHQNYRGSARDISEVKYESIAKTLSESYQKAGVDPETVHYIEVDGYATKWADSFEYEGIKGAFANDASSGKHVALGSAKGNIGNVESVSGIANVIKVALSFVHQRFPATISMNKPNSFMDLDNTSHPLYVADHEISFEDIRRSEEEPIRAGVNSFADSGTNIHLLLEEYRGGETAAGAAPAPIKRPFVLSARNADRLQRYVEDFVEFLHNDDDTAFADIVYTSQVGRQPLNERIAVIAASREELLEKLNQVMKANIQQGLRLESKGIYHGRFDPADKNSMARLVTFEMAQTQLVQSLRSGQWKQVALLWVNGVAIPWERIWQGISVRRVSLPTYPFARHRHWIDVKVEDGDQYRAVASISTPESEQPEGQRAAAAEPAEAAESAPWYVYLPTDLSKVSADAVAMSRNEKMELFLRQETARQLECGFDEVSLDKDFLDLGMTSVGVAELIIKTDSLLATNLSPSVVFKHPEIGTLAGYLAESYPDLIDALVVTRTEPAAGDIKQVEAAEETSNAQRGAPTPGDVLVPLQPKGDKTPIFAVPGAGGSAMSMQQLCESLGRTQPFYCLEPVGLDGAVAPMRSIEQVAAFNLAAVREVQGEGSFRLLGYSNGGVVAFEMARQLLAEGARVGALILLDSLSPQVPGKDPTREMVEVFNHFVSSLGGQSDLTAETLAQVGEGERGEFLYDTLIDLGLNQVPKQQFMATFEAARASDEACRNYRPHAPIQELNVTLIRSTDGFPDAPEDYGWNELLSHKVRLKRIEGDHFSFLEGESSWEVAKGIRSALRRPRKKSARKAELEADTASG